MNSKTLLSNPSKPSESSRQSSPSNPPSELDHHSKMPLAYRTGHQNFYGREFFVTPDTLIPRPETEQLIDTVLNLAGLSYLPGVKPAPRLLPERLVIIDVGTGSGCIAITLKKALPEAEVIATDISEKALEVAKTNAEAQNAPIIPIISHLVKNVNTPADLVVANLPYVDENWDWLDKAALSYEPSSALYAKDHGLALIKELIDEVSSPFLVLEADPCQHEEIVAYAKKHDYLLKEIRGYSLCFSRENK